MMKAISEAFERRPLKTLDEDKELMLRLRQIQTADYPDMDLFSRTRASKLAMAVGGPLFLAGLFLVLLKAPTNPLLGAGLWILGALIFGLGLTTKRAFAGWGKKGRSTGL